MKKFIIILILFFSILVFKVYSKNFEILNYKGLKYTFYNDNGDISSINVLVRAGSIFDKRGKFGTAYILSKMLKNGGTQKYSTDNLFNLLDEKGIFLSTSCDKDFIIINLKFINKNVKTALDVFEQILFKPLFNQKEFKSIKKEVLAEIISYQNNNDYLAIHQGFVELLSSDLFSHSSFGTIDNVKNINLSDIKKFYKEFFIPNNIIISFCGNIQKKQVEKILKRNINKNFSRKILAPKLKFSKKVKSKIIKEKDLKQSYIYFLFPSVGETSKDKYTVNLLSFILGGNLTSILAEKIRKEKGLAYSIFSTNYGMVEGGVFVIGLQTENRKAKLAIKEIINTLKKLKNNGIKKEKLIFAKKFITGRIPIGLQSISNISSSLTNGIFFEKEMPPWDYDIKKYQEVTIKNINELIEKIFNFNKMVISIVGKPKDN